MDDFLSPQEKIQLCQVLAKTNQLRTPDERTNFLTFCGLEKYCNSVQIADSSDKFSISIYNQLSKNYVNDCQKLALFVFLEYLIEVDSSLSQEDKNFIEYILNKGLQQSHINSQPSPEQITPLNQIQPNSLELVRQEKVPRSDLENAPDVSFFYGRTEELSILEQWLQNL